MTNSSLITSFSIAGLVFLTIAVVGQAKFAFAEINPGGFGRFLALILGVVSLTIAALLLIFPVELLEGIRTYLAEQIQQNINNLVPFRLSS